MAYIYPTLLGILTLLAMAGCAEDIVDVLPYPYDCYQACSDCCRERYAGGPDFCLAACSDSPTSPEGFPQCTDFAECRE